MGQRPLGVKSGHVQCNSACPLCAKSGLVQRSKKLFDHLVGALKQRRRHGKPERLGGLQVNH